MIACSLALLASSGCLFSFGSTSSTAFSAQPDPRVKNRVREGDSLERVRNRMGKPDNIAKLQPPPVPNDIDSPQERDAFLNEQGDLAYEYGEYVVVFNRNDVVIAVYSKYELKEALENE